MQENKIQNSQTKLILVDKKNLQINNYDIICSSEENINLEKIRTNSEENSS